MARPDGSCSPCAAASAPRTLLPAVRVIVCGTFSVALARLALLGVLMARVEDLLYLDEPLLVEHEFARVVVELGGERCLRVAAFQLSVQELLV